MYQGVGFAADDDKFFSNQEDSSNRLVGFHHRDAIGNVCVRVLPLYVNERLQRLFPHAVGVVPAMVRVIFPWGTGSVIPLSAEYYRRGRGRS